MRKRSMLFLLLLIVSAAVHAQEVEPDWLEVADVFLNLHAGPSTDHEVILRLGPREAVVLLERREHWSQVRRQDGQTGWARNDFLLPWNEFSRLDTWWRVGDKRLFRFFHGTNNERLTVEAELRVISDHVYFYTHARHEDNALPDDQALQRIAELFDEKIYRRSLDFRGIEDPPDFDGDERIVVLVLAGYRDQQGMWSWYSSRHDMPQESGSRGVGFIGISLSDHRETLRYFDSNRTPFVLSSLAHQFQELLQHHAGGVRSSWISAGMAALMQEILEQERVLEPTRFMGRAETRLHSYDGPSSHSSMLFMLYVLERLGPETLNELATFAARPEHVLDSLDAVLEGHPAGLDADTFFADWALTNILLDTRREGGRYGYHLLDRSELALPPPSTRVEQLPARFEAEAPPYSASYYELPLPQDSAAADHLLLDFRLNEPPPQDAWLQFVQVLPDSIDIQRFRASEYGNQPILASLREGPERVFVAVSPFTTGDRQRTRPVSFSLALRQQATPADPQAQVTTTLNLRSRPEVADNIIGRLQPCSVLRVLQRDEQWSQVRTGAGLIGWAHNDYLHHLNAPSPGVSPRSCAALVRAAHDGDLATVQNLLAAGTDVNGQDAWGRTALHEAALRGHERVLAHLLRAGASVHLQDSAGRTPLDEVTESGDADSIMMLLRAGTGPDPGDPRFRPPVVSVAATGNSDLLELFLNEGHDPDWRGQDGRAALAAAAANGHDAILRQLLAFGADAQQVDGDGRSSLMLAAASGKHSAFAPLLDAAVDVNLQDVEGHSALTLAAAKGHALSVAWLLLGSDADIHHSLPHSGRNALHLAAAGGHADVIAMLRLAGLDPAAQDRQGHGALQLAEAADHDLTAEYLRMPVSWTPVRGLKLSPQERDGFLSAAARGDLAEVERYLEAGAQFLLVSRDREGMTALMLAARAGHQDVVLRLLLAGADPDLRWNTGWDEPAIFFTIRNGHDDLTAMLLLAGATPASRPMTSPFKSALSWAAEFGQEKIVHLLLALRDTRYIDVNVRDHSDRTPLLTAVTRGHTNIVRSLLAAGADPNLRPLRPVGQSILELCAGSCNQEIRNLLLAAGAEA
ncbi:MAG: ankyrin repeat domain-containing protein [Anaerolineaceae bacterium]|nr:ankyrin repeat domain-containing protein [Anaerolineaceae bacterium]